jgi:hypothetical protein
MFFAVIGGNFDGAIIFMRGQFALYEDVSAFHEPFRSLLKAFLQLSWSASPFTGRKPRLSSTPLRLPTSQQSNSNAGISSKGTTRNTWVSYESVRKSAREEHTAAAPSRAQPDHSRIETKRLLVGAKEMVIGGVWYKRLLTDIGRCGTAGSWSRSALRI